MKKAFCLFSSILIPVVSLHGATMTGEELPLEATVYPFSEKIVWSFAK